ncbi:MAG: DEAD/DEAH box helicase [Endozoicomonadaceae bacterium]|nr:DEAD/DEAH box helicase [Endozoicomonadaceae bacterium]
MSFSEFELNQDLKASLNGAGYENPTLLQKQILPLITERKNLIVGSQTASGKTGAFLIPMASYLIDNPIEEHQGSRILILTSRRERVNHINYTLKRIFKNYTVRVGFISGGRPYQHQMRLLKRPLDVLIATPGRLNDLVENNKANFSELEMLIIDDYTTIHHHGLQSLCTTIVKQASDKCQYITFVQKDDESEASLKELLPDAINIEVAEEKHPLVSIPQEVYIADDHTHKIALMDQMLDELEDQATLIYTASNHSADTLVENLINHGHPAIRAQQSNEPVTAEQHPIIVISDQTNINVITHSYKNIIHFELPKQTASFQNRIMNKGWEELEKPSAIIAGPHDRVTLKKIETESGESLEQNTLIGLEPLNTYTSTPLLSLSPNKQKAKGKKQQHNTKRKGARSLTSPRKNSNNKQKSHKGQYGRLSGGIHRKRGGNNGNSIQQSQPQQGKTQHNKSNQNTSNSYRSKNFSNPTMQEELSERQPKKRNVVIRYKERKKRSLSLKEKTTPTPESSNEQVD